MSRAVRIRTGFLNWLALRSRRMSSPSALREHQIEDDGVHVLGCGVPKAQLARFGSGDSVAFLLQTPLDAAEQFGFVLDDEDSGHVRQLTVAS